MNGFDTTQRFFRPTDVSRLRRNQRQIQIARLLVVLRNAAFVVVIGVVAIGVYRNVHNGSRFAVRQIEVGGAVHAPRAALDAVTQRYLGANLFDLDIARVQNDLRGVSWIRAVNVEKKLPGTLRINVVERKAVALVQRSDRLAYVDEDGVTFAELSPHVGDEDLPIIADASGEELARSIALVRDLRTRDPQVYSRISEVKPIAPKSFALFDRELGAFVYANAEDVSAKWRTLYGVMRAENLGANAIEYADLRFNDRIVVKPKGSLRTGHENPTTQGVANAQD
ncbi:MAG: FtsQ-type POTRA domain-containing protein [Acidobacteria bacterium]|nr:FtsQ-type POTRA domain-containing protein [Acidobacteriota bacterium]